MSASLHHVNWLVYDIVSASQKFAEFLQQQPQIERLTQRNVVTARFELGNAWLVLVSPLDPDSFVGKILASRGEGLFLLSLSGFDSLTDAQFALMDEDGKRSGLADWQIWDVSGLSTATSILQIFSK